MSVSREWAMKNNSLSKLFANYSPANWHHLPKLGKDIYTRECAALGALRELYDCDGASAAWIEVQVTGLFLSAANDNTTLLDGLSIFADNFAESASQYKLTELMLFFSRYKAGCYDNSFTTFDPRRIGLAFHKEFLPERERAIGKMVSDKQASDAGRDWYNASEHGGVSSLDFYKNNDLFDTEVVIRKDSEQLRKDLNITEHVGVNGHCVSRLPKEHLLRITKYKESGEILVL